MTDERRAHTAAAACRQDIMSVVDQPQPKLITARRRHAPFRTVDGALTQQTASAAPRTVPASTLPLSTKRLHVRALVNMQTAF